MSRALAAALALFAAALLLGLYVAWAGVPGFDPPIANALSVERARGGFWLAVTRAGDWEARITLGLAAAAFLWFRHSRRAGITLLSVAAVQTLSNSGLKLLFARARPELFDHLDYTWDLSYPSGHAAQNAALYLLAALLIDRRLLWIAVPLVLLIGVSRIVLGVHWPSDVMGGWLEGAGFALLGLHVAQARLATRADP